MDQKGFRAGEQPLLPDSHEFPCSFLKHRPGRFEGQRPIVGLFIEWFRTPRRIHLNKLHNGIHPRWLALGERGAPECHDNLRASAVNLPAPDLHNIADGDRFVAAEIENTLKNEVGVEAGGPEGGGVTGLERQSKQGPCVQGSMMIGVAGQHEAMGQGFDVLRWGLWHARRVPCKMSPVGTCWIAIEEIYHDMQMTATGANRLRTRRKLIENGVGHFLTRIVGVLPDIVKRDSLVFLAHP